MNQLLLPIRSLRVPARHVDWLRLANAAEYREKSFWFYPFKTKFLRQHGLSDGLDLQVIIDRCWCGDGIWRGIEGQIPERYWDTCWKCNGTGIYRERRIVLIRWLVNGSLFHEPSHFQDCEHFIYKEKFSGLIRHGGVPSKVGRRAMFKLFLRYDLRRLYRFYRWRYYEMRYWLLHRLRWRLIKLERNLRAISMRAKLVYPFGSYAGDDDIPF